MQFKRADRNLFRLADLFDEYLKESDQPDLLRTLTVATIELQDFLHDAVEPRGVVTDYAGEPRRSRRMASARPCFLRQQFRRVADGRQGIANLVGDVCSEAAKRSQLHLLRLHLELGRVFKKHHKLALRTAGGIEQPYLHTAPVDFHL